MCDLQDLEAIPPIQDYLFDQGYEVNLSLFEEEEKKVREFHQENLRQCDASLIYYGKGNQLWLRNKLLDFKKALGFREGKPFLAKAVYIAGPLSEDKVGFRTHEAMVLKNGDVFDPEVLSPFLSKLQKKL